jgi:cytochrome c peroxidase
MNNRITLKPTWKRAALVTLGALALHGCSKEAPQSPAPQAAVAAPAPAPATPPAPKPAPLDPVKLVQAFKPTPSAKDAPKSQDTAEQIALGRMLFFDARLSKNHDVSCNSTRKTPKPDPTPEQRRAQQGKT